MLGQNRLTVAIDFDGVLHQYSGWKGAEIFDEPYPWAKEFLERCQEVGYKVVVHSTRDPALIKKWLRKHGLAGAVDHVTSLKPPAIAYVDDRAVRFDPRDMDRVFDGIAKVPWWKLPPVKTQTIGTKYLQDVEESVTRILEIQKKGDMQSTGAVLSNITNVFVELLENLENDGHLKWRP